MTALHVVTDKMFQGQVWIRRFGFQKMERAYIVGAPDKGDIAVLKILLGEHETVPYLHLGFDFYPLRQGYVFGHPDTNPNPHASQGVVAHAQDGALIVEFDANTSEGFSGGLVIDQYGKCFALLHGAKLKGTSTSLIVPMAYSANWIVSQLQVTSEDAKESESPASQCVNRIRSPPQRYTPYKAIILCNPELSHLALRLSGELSDANSLAPELH